MADTQEHPIIQALRELILPPAGGSSEAKGVQKDSVGAGVSTEGTAPPETLAADAAAGATPPPAPIVEDDSPETAISRRVLIEKAESPFAFVNDPDVAKIVLQARGYTYGLDEKTGEPVMSKDGVEVPMDYAALTTALGETQMRSLGRPGSGIQEEGRVPGTPHDVLASGLASQASYDKDPKAYLEAYERDVKRRKGERTITNVRS